jgi:hypothetical protein
MGLCMCTMLGFPIGSCVGCGTALCCSLCCGGGNRNNNDSFVDEDNNNYETVRNNSNIICIKIAFGAVLAAGCICYIILTIGCARADGNEWTLIRTTGNCWSEGGDMPFVELGLITGALLGVGLVGTLIMACHGSFMRLGSNQKHTRYATTGDHYKQAVEMPGVGVV